VWGSALAPLPTPQGTQSSTLGYPTEPAAPCLQLPGNDHGNPRAAIVLSPLARTGSSFTGSGPFLSDAGFSGRTLTASSNWDIRLPKVSSPRSSVRRISELTFMAR
jgi:hypothetical protein